MIHHTYSYRSYQRKKHIDKRKRIAREVYGFDWYKHDGQYDKGKVFCDCPLCKPSKHGWCKDFNTELAEADFKFNMNQYEKYCV